MGNLKQQIRDYILQENNVSFRELENRFPELIEPDQGDNLAPWYELEGNIVLWIGWTKEAFEMIAELKATNQISFQPCEVLIYAVDGKVLKLPVVKTNRKHKKPRWAPIVLCRPEL